MFAKYQNMILSFVAVTDLIVRQYVRDCDRQPEEHYLDRNRINMK